MTSLRSCIASKFGLPLASLLFAGTVSARTYIQVDQFGYLPGETKVAVLADPQVGFDSGDSYAAPSTIQVRRSSDDAVVLSVPTTVHESGTTDPASGDRGWWVDFSTLETEGTYYLYDAVSGERSHAFDVSEDVYGEVLRTACRMFYYNRCGTEKPAQYAGANWSDTFCFAQDTQTRDIQNPNDSARYKDLSGGWFDAGDYNKYVTFAHGPLHDLLSAFEESPEVFSDDYGLPESGNGVPDLLDEVRWELEWLLRMNDPSGATHIKMGSVSFDQNTGSPPSVNDDPRYYGPFCSAASIAVASVFSHAALVYSSVPGMEAFVQLLRTRAQSAWSWSLPYFLNGTLQTGCDDGSILAGDADWTVDDQSAYLVTAAVYLFELTAAPEYDDFVIAHYGSTEPIASGFWGPYRMPLTDALLRYAALPEADPTAAATIVSSFSTDASNNWSGYYGFDGRDLYRAFMPDWSYHWGSNLPRVHYGTLNLQLERYGIPGSDPQSEAEIARAHIHWLHGANPLGLCYLSNMYAYGAEAPLNQIYHGWFADGTIWDHALESERGPAPGYVSGGPNAQFSVPGIQPPAGQPLQKSYLDFNDDWPNNSWEVSEPAIYYQAGYIRLLASMVSATTTGVEPVEGLPEQGLDGRLVLRVKPNPTEGSIEILDPIGSAGARLFDISGRQIHDFPREDVEQGVLDLSGTVPGVYILESDGRTARIVVYRSSSPQTN